MGIDVNEEMIERVKETNSNTNAKFLLGDITKKKTMEKLNSSFDTITFLGNSICHFSTIEFLNLLRALETVVHQETALILEDRDVVNMLYNNKWKGKLTIHRPEKDVKIQTINCDTVNGVINQKTVGEHPVHVIHGI